MTNAFKIKSILSSLFPLFLCVSLKFIIELFTSTYEIIFENKLASFIIYAVLTILSIILFLVSLSMVICSHNHLKRVAASDTDKDTFKVLSLSRKKNFTLDFLVTFIIPLISFFQSNNPIEAIIGYLITIIYIFIISFIKFRNNEIYDSIFYEFSKWNFYEVTVTCKIKNNEEPFTVLLITKENYKSKPEILIAEEISNEILIK